MAQGCYQLFRCGNQRDGNSAPWQLLSPQRRTGGEKSERRRRSQYHAVILCFHISTSSVWSPGPIRIIIVCLPMNCPSGAGRNAGGGTQAARSYQIIFYHASPIYSSISLEGGQICAILSSETWEPAFPVAVRKGFSVFRPRPDYVRNPVSQT